jgi:hypothetical protein
MKILTMIALKSLTIVLSTLLLASCASSPKSTFVYVQVFDAGVGYPKAIAQCQYEDHLQRRADTRADVDSGRGLLAMLANRPSDTQIFCMKRFGWELQEQLVQPNSMPISPQSNSQFPLKNSNLPTTQKPATSDSLPSEAIAENKARQQLRELAKKNNSRCTDESYKLFYSKSPCSSSSVEERFYSNKDLITDEEAVIANLVFLEGKVYEQQRTIFMKQYGSVRDKILMEINARYITDFDKNRAQLLNRSISWGQYNKRRAELNEKMMAEMNAVPK